jgi:hypothetical protein
MKKLLFPFSILVIIILFAFKNNNDVAKAENKKDIIQSTPPKDISSDSAKKMMKFFVNNAKKSDHAFTKFSRKQLIEVLESMTTDTVKFVIGAYASDVRPPLRNKPVILLQIRMAGSVPGGAAFDRFSYLEGSLCPPPDAPPCNALLEN